MQHQITVDYVGDALTNEEVLEVLALNLREYVNRCELEDNAPDAMVACIERMLGGDYEASYTAVIIE